jgi:hypothetical protein
MSSAGNLSSIHELRSGNRATQRAYRLTRQEMAASMSASASSFQAMAAMPSKMRNPKKLGRRPRTANSRK